MVTWRWPPTSGPGSGPNWSSGWSTRCSAGCTRAGRSSCRSRPRWGRWPPRPRSHRALSEAAASLLPPASPAGPGQPPAPRPAVFTTLASGLGALPAAVAAASGATVRTRATVRELARTATGWRLTVGLGRGSGVHRGRRGGAGPARAARVPAAERGGRRVGGRRRAGRDRVRQHGHCHAGLPAIPVPGGPGAHRPGPQRIPDPRGRRPGGQGRDLLHHQVAASRARRRPDRHRPLLDRPDRRGERAPARRRRPDRAGHGRTGRGDRGPGRAGGQPGHPLGRRPAPVHGGAPGPGGHDPRRRGRPAGPGRVRGRLRRDRHPRLYRYRVARRRTRSAVISRRWHDRQ